MIKEQAGTTQEQQEILKTINSNVNWINQEHGYLMADVYSNSTKIVMQGTREVLIPTLVKEKSRYAMMSRACRQASMWTRTLDHFDKKFKLSEENDTKVLLLIKTIIR